SILKPHEGGSFEPLSFFWRRAMALPSNHPLTIIQLFAHTPSVGASPVAGYTRSHVRGKVIEVGVVLGGTITTADATIATTINGTAITGGSITPTPAGSVPGSRVRAAPTAPHPADGRAYIPLPPPRAPGCLSPTPVYTRRRPR